MQHHYDNIFYNSFKYLSFRKKQKELPRVAPFLCQEVSSYNFFRGKPL